MEQPATEAPVLSDNPAESRFEVHVGGELAGFVMYYRRGAQLIDLVHTEVEDEFQGTGLAGKLAKFSLDTAREQHLHVLPSCPYIRGWIVRHPDYQDLVANDRRADFGRGSVENPADNGQ